MFYALVQTKYCLLIILFNAPATTGSRCAALVNHDLYGGSP